MTRYTISEDLLNAILKTLSARPFVEVATLIQAIREDTVLVEETISEEDE